VTHGRRFRIDTTVVETNVHYPTDSSLLQDGVRVLTRTMQHAGAALGDVTAVRNRLRSIARRCLAIRRQSRTPATRPELVTSYRRLMATTRAVVREASTMIRRIGHRLGTAATGTRPILHHAQRRLQTTRRLSARFRDRRATMRRTHSRLDAP
jgi:IS5 family transposase